VSEKRKVWVLDTETKGTGAEMIPLEKLEERRRKSAVERERVSVISRSPAAPEAPPEPAAPPAPHRFKIVNLLSRQVLAEDVEAQEAVDVLRGVRSIVDVNVYVFDEDDPAGWRALTFGEKRALWSFRDRVAGG